MHTRARWGTQVPQPPAHSTTCPPNHSTTCPRPAPRLQVWTNGRYMPTPHRVLNTHSSSSRVSIPYFYEPAFEARVAPIPELCGAEGPRFPEVRYGSHLESKVLNNFEL
jgi:isopenicillin N synthase-like dioxygenase